MFAFILSVTLPLSAQQWRAVTPEEAQSHLLKKVEPVYPRFARLAGIEGTIQLEVGIYDDGRIHSVSGAERQSPVLREAAQRAVSQYVYRPFVKDGKAVSVSTTLSVEFKLPAGESKHWPAADVI